MNRIQDYYVLNQLDLPTIPWERYYHSTPLNKDILWTIKSEVLKGDDTNLPKKIGVTAKEAKAFGKNLYKQLDRGQMVYCYPYFCAVKSGIIDINYDRVAIEAVKDDIANLVSNHKVDVTMIFKDDDLDIIGDENFLTRDEVLELIDCSVSIKKQCAGDIEFGKNFMFHWSYVYETSTKKEPVGNKNLVFYKIKII